MRRGSFSLLSVSDTFFMALSNAPEAADHPLPPFLMAIPIISNYFCFTASFCALFTTTRIDFARPLFSSELFETRGRLAMTS